MNRLVSILIREAKPNFISRNELPSWFETQMSTELLPNIYNANKSPLRILGIIKLRVHLGHTRVVLKFIVCETLVASAIIGTDFCDQHVKAIRPNQKFLEL